MTARLIGPDKGCIETDIGGHRLRRQADGTYHVDDPHTARRLVREGFGVAGTRIRTGEQRDAPGPWCAHERRPFFCPDCKGTTVTE